jgi:hypothetical protein
VTIGVWRGVTSLTKCGRCGFVGRAEHCGIEGTPW